MASKIKKSWAQNFFKGVRGENMLVAEQNSQICGFVQLLTVEKNIQVIDLIAVDKKFQGQGVGQALVSEIHSLISNCTRIRVGTQLANKSSIGFYIKSGFQFSDAQYVFHFHGES